MIQIGKIDIFLGCGEIQTIVLLKKVIRKIVPSRYSNLALLRGTPSGNDQTFARGIAHELLTGGHHFLVIQIGKIDI